MSCVFFHSVSSHLMTARWRKHDSPSASIFLACAFLPISLPNAKPYGAPWAFNPRRKNAQCSGDDKFCPPPSRLQFASPYAPCLWVVSTLRPYYWRLRNFISQSPLEFALISALCMGRAHSFYGWAPFPLPFYLPFPFFFFSF